MNKNECCEGSAAACVAAEVLTQVDARDQDLARLAKACAHPQRVHILRLLSAHDSCICAEVVNDLGLPQSTVSQHLRVLKDAGLIRATADGRTMCYCIHPDGLRRLRMLIAEI